MAIPARHSYDLILLGADVNKSVKDHPCFAVLLKNFIDQKPECLDLLRIKLPTVVQDMYAPAWIVVSRIL